MKPKAWSMNLKNQLLLDTEQALARAEQTLQERLAHLVLPENPCAHCLECCKGQVIATHQVTAPELDLIALKHGQQVAQNFSTYLKRVTDPQGELLFPICPNYENNLLGPGQGGCAIHKTRPLSCRVFGAFRKAGTVLPVPCTFRGYETPVPDEEYFDLIPQARELREIGRDYQLLLEEGHSHPAQPITQAKSTGAASEAMGLDRFSPIDQALTAVAAGQPEKALEILRSSLGWPTPESMAQFRPSQLEIWGMVLAACEQHHLARDCYWRLLEVVPRRTDLLYQLACCLFQLQDPEGAQKLWEESAQLNPDYAPTQGMLGYLALARHQYPQAQQHFERAARNAPEIEMYQQRAAMAAHLAQQVDR